MVGSGCGRNVNAGWRPPHKTSNISRKLLNCEDRARHLLAAGLVKGSSLKPWHNTRLDLVLFAALQDAAMDGVCDQYAPFRSFANTAILIR